MLSKDEVAALLGKTILFGPLDDATRKTVAQEVREVHYDAGQTIFSRGDDGTDLLLVVSGRVRLSVLTPEGRELSFAHAGQGQIFGEIAVLDGGERTADATAVTKTIALTLSKVAFMKLFDENSVVRKQTIKFLCNRVREADHQLEGIALYPIEVRLARFFLAAVHQKSPKTTAGSVTIDMPISQGELALLIGASRPKVNAALALLEDRGAIDRKETSVICNVEELEDIAGA